MKKRQDRRGFYIELSIEDAKIVADLKSAAINVSQFLRNCLYKKHAELEKEMTK